MSISNNQGGFDGQQNLGGYSMRVGKGAISANLATDTIASGSHDGDFDGAKQISIASISGSYDDRFDDYDYYVV